MTVMLVALGISALGLIAFIVRDSMAAFGDGPTLSDKIKAWANQSSLHKFLVFLPIAQAGIVLGWLTLHLVVQVF